MNKALLFAFMTILFITVSCNQGDSKTTYVSIYKIAEYQNVWCFYIGEHFYNSFQDSTLYLDNSRMIRSQFRPDLREEYVYKVIIDHSKEICFDSISYSNDCDGRYCVVFDAILKKDICCVYVHFPYEKMGKYAFSLTDIELSFLNILLSRLPTTNYVRIDNERNGRNMRFSQLSLFNKQRNVSSIVNMYSNDIDTNVAICMDAIESVVCKHINDSKERDTLSMQNPYRVEFEQLLLNYGIYCNFPENPPPSI